MPTDDGGSTDVVLLPLLMGGRRPGVRRPLPQIGEHTDEILAGAAEPTRRPTAADSSDRHSTAISHGPLPHRTTRRRRSPAPPSSPHEATLIGEVSVGERASVWPAPSRAPTTSRSSIGDRAATSRKAPSCTPTPASR